MDELFESELDPFTMSSLQACCNALGSNEKHGYVKEADCIESVRELIKRLRNDTNTCEVRRYLGAAQILQRDLIQIVKTYYHETALFDIVIRLLINLTQPADACFDTNAVRNDVHLQKCFLEVRTHLGTYKRAFADVKFFECLAQRCARLLSVDWTTRQADDRLLIERILILVCNILRIEPAPDSSSHEKWTAANDNASWCVAQHAVVCGSLLSAGFGDIILFAANNEDDFSAHVLELVQLTLRYERAIELGSHYERFTTQTKIQPSNIINATSSTPRSSKVVKTKTDNSSLMNSTSQAVIDASALELRSILEREQFAKRAARFASGARSRLSGTFLVQNLNAPAAGLTLGTTQAAAPTRRMIVHAPLERFVAHAQTGSFLFDLNKKCRRQPRNRMTADCDEAATDRLAQNATNSLYDSEETHVQLVGAFCIELLESAFNTLMRNVLHAVQAETRGSQSLHDEQACFWAIRFFAEFVISYKRCALVDCIAEVLRIDAFHVLLTRIERYSESLKLDKQNARLWASRQHCAIRAYRALLGCIASLIQRPPPVKDAADAESMRRSARTLFGRLAYTVEHRDLAFRMIHEFDATRHSRAYLRELIEMAHEFLKLLEVYVRDRDGVLLVERASKRRYKMKAKEKAKARAKQDKWLSIAAELRSEFAERSDKEKEPAPTILALCPPPFDAALPIAADRQPKLALVRLQSLLQHAPRSALALYRRSREVFPNEFSIESAEAPKDALSDAAAISNAELAALEEIWNTDLQAVRGQLKNELGDAKDFDDGNALKKLLRDDAVRFGDLDADDDIIMEDAFETDDGNTSSDADTDSDEEQSRREATFNLRDFIERFADSKVLRSIFMLLSSFERNTPSANHAALRLLGRLAFEHPQQQQQRQRTEGDQPSTESADGLVGTMFQLGLFRTFHRAFAPTALREKQFDELREFARRVLRRFADATKRNPKLFIEALFYRQVRTCREIVTGLYSNEPQEEAKRHSKWTEELEKELNDLFLRLRLPIDTIETDEPVVPANSDGDMIDRIMKSLSDRTKTKRQIAKKLITMRLINSVAELGIRRLGPSKRLAEWNEAECEELRTLFTMFRDHENVAAAIAQNATQPGLAARSVRQIRTKLVELGVADRAALRKRRTKRSDGDIVDRVNFDIEREHVALSGAGVDSSSDSDSSVDDNELEKLLERFREEADTRRPVVQPQKPKQDSAKRKSEQIPTKPSSRTGFRTITSANTLSSVKNGPHAAALNWLASKMKQNATKRRDAAKIVDAALVSVSVENDAALEDSEFHQLLVACGLHPPRDDDGQVYWRIPASLTANELESCANWLLGNDLDVNDVQTSVDRQDGESLLAGKDDTLQEVDRASKSLLQASTATVRPAKDTSKSKKKIKSKPKAHSGSDSDSDVSNTQTESLLRTLFDDDSDTAPKSASKSKSKAQSIDARPKLKVKKNAQSKSKSSTKDAPSGAKKKQKKKNVVAQSESESDVDVSNTQTESLLKTLFNDDHVERESTTNTSSKSQSGAGPKRKKNSSALVESEDESDFEISTIRKRKAISRFVEEDENENEREREPAQELATAEGKGIHVNTSNEEPKSTSADSDVAVKRRRIVIDDSDEY